MVQIQDAGGDGCSRITLRNNILHDSYNNDILKINNAATQVLVEYMRLNTEGSNLPNHAIQFFNNIWTDPTGTMGTFSTTPAGQTDAFTLLRNLYWNNGSALASSSANLVNIDDDASPLEANPSLTNPTGIARPRWNPATGRLGDGSSNVCGAFQSLVERFAAPSSGGAGIDEADAAHASPDDILGRARGANPDVGAWER